MLRQTFYHSLRLKSTVAAASEAASIVPPISAAALVKQLKGPKSYPVVGGLPYFIKQGGIKRIDVYFEQLYKDYGMVSKMELFDSVYPLLFHPEDQEKVFRAEGKHPSASADAFQSFDHYMKQRDFAHLNLGALAGDAWRDIRAKLQKHILPPSSLPPYAPGIARISEDMSTVIHQYGDNLREIIPRFTAEVIANVIFGKRLGTILNPTEKDMMFVRSAADIFELGSELDGGMPVYKYFNSALSPKYKKFSKMVDQVFERGREEIKLLAENLDKDPEKYAQTYLARVMAEPGMTMERVNANITGIFFAGVDTTSNTLIWLLYHLAKFPQAQETLYQELASTLQGKTLEDNETSLPYLKKCVKESYRLDPLGGGVIRRVNRDIELTNGVKVPAGMKVMMNPVPLFRDEKIFERPFDFVPERWNDGEKEKREKAGNFLADHPFLLIPFAFGPRICLGARLAALEMNIFISRIIQDYRIEFLPGQPEIKRINKFFYYPDPIPKLKFHKRK